ncbi:6-hydroxymethylpterin diphosphokinase MptE-like protein [Oceanispirochaeta crateris]|nr:6-hydroxymethylpterin diphosphokinase MptE-like protein [Oceanispirochaeta crateris]
MSQSGTPTARINNKYLHSKYDPLKEARLFVNNFIQDKSYSKNKLIIVLEPGLGYLLNELSLIHPQNLIFSVFFHSNTYQYCSEKGVLDNIFSYAPNMNDSLTTVLDKTLTRLNMRDIIFLEWPASKYLFPDECKHIRYKILEHLRILQGNEITKRQFSKLWICNGIRNYLRHDYSTCIASPLDRAVILAASGPSLENHIDRIQELQKDYFIVALPSSLSILKEYDIIPDILFTTDPGFYAREHLKYLDPSTLCIAPVTASFRDNQNHLAGINQGSYIESLLFKNNELPFLAEMGTVAATALTFLKEICTHPIYIAGLDFCIKDIKMHAEPHSFKSIILKNENRFFPGVSSYFNRANDMAYKIENHFRYSKSMDTYSAWFRNQKFPDNFLRLSPIQVNLPFKTKNTIPSISMKGTKQIVLKRSIHYPNLRERIRKISELRSSLNHELHQFEKSSVPTQFLNQTSSELFPEFSISDNPEEIISRMKLFLHKIGQLI